MSIKRQSKQKLPFAAERESKQYLNEVILLSIKEFDKSRQQFCATENVLVCCHGKKCNYPRQDKDGYIHSVKSLFVLVQFCPCATGEICANNYVVKYSPHIGEMRLARPSCRSVGSAGWYEVGGLVRPLAHCFNPAICSAINVDNGTNSMRIRATSKSPSSQLLSKAKYKASVDTLSISLPVNPSVALANCTRSKSGGLRPYCRIGMPRLLPFHSGLGRPTNIIASNLPFLSI